MTAEELFEAVVGLPGVKSLPKPGDGILDAKLVGGVELARAADADEKRLRKTWKERFGGGPTPLLLVADDERDQTLRALGPLDGAGPLRTVGSEDLLRVLERIAQLSRLDATRLLGEELDRLDQAGIPGLHVRGLGTEHLFTRRIRDGERWQRLGELAAGAAGDWRPLLESLGWTIDKLPHRGYLLRDDRRRAAVVWPLKDPADFAKLDAEGRPPEGVLIADCLREGVPYGLLVSGGRFRLFEAAPASGSAVARYLELDAAALQPADRPLLGLLAPEYLAGDGFAELMRDARDSAATYRASEERQGARNA